MLTILIGTDPKLKSAARKKLWKGAVQDLDLHTTTIEEFAAIAATPTLFAQPQAYRLQNIFSSGTEEGVTADSVLDMAKDLIQSPHTFILEEEKLLARPKAALQKAGVEIIELKTETKKETFNVFAFGDALSKKDRKRLWLLLMEASREGIAPENIAGILAWKARNMLTSARDPEDQETYRKLSRNLVMMYHDSHRGAGDLALLLERFALKL